MGEFEFSKELHAKYQEDGYLVVKEFFSEDLCDRLQKECSNIINEMNPEDHHTIFSTGNHEQMSEEYFITSGDKIRFFWEREAVDENGKLNRPKQLALNKIGHALHILNAKFKEATFSPKLEMILHRLGYKRPVIPQSMYIFKQPHIGGNVCKHIDASFLESTPLKLTGFWIALEDADLENGCLFFSRGSHKNAEVTYRMIKDPNAGAKERLIFDGKLDEIEDEKFTPVPVKKGSLIIIDGKVQHMSAKNASDRSRHIYTFHVTESYKTEWSKRNWLQPTHTPFPVVYERTD